MQVTSVTKGDAFLVVGITTPAYVILVTLDFTVTKVSRQTTTALCYFCESVYSYLKKYNILWEVLLKPCKGVFNTTSILNRIDTYLPTRSQYCLYVNRLMREPFNEKMRF